VPEGGWLFEPAKWRIGLRKGFFRPAQSVKIALAQYTRSGESTEIEQRSGGMKEIRCHILFVEDHLDTQEIVSMFLQIEGYQVTCARTAAEALKLAGARTFDLYLLDSRLPDESGIALCGQLRESDPHTPIIFYSANAYETDKRQALAAGAQGYLTKPCSLTELEDLIAEFLQGQCQTSSVG
jgi:CheY-like chemotaxis protein